MEKLSEKPSLFNNDPRTGYNVTGRGLGELNVEQNILKKKDATCACVLYNISCHQKDYEDFYDYERKMMKLDMLRKKQVYSHTMKKHTEPPMDLTPTGWVPDRTRKY